MTETTDQRRANADALDAVATPLAVVGTVLILAGAWLAFGWPGLFMSLGAAMLGIAISWMKVSLEMRR